MKLLPPATILLLVSVVQQQVSSARRSKHGTRSRNTTARKGDAMWLGFNTTNFRFLGRNMMVIQEMETGKENRQRVRRRRNQRKIPTIPFAGDVSGDKTTKDDSSRAQRIVGGKLAIQGQFPSFAFAVSGDCGATLIAPNVALGAAHCESAYDAGVWLNTTMRNAGSEQGARRYVVKNTKVHPNFDFDSFENDFQLIFLRDKVDIDSFVRPAIVNEDPNVPLPVGGSKTTTVGLGSMVQDGGGYASDELRFVTVPHVSHTSCESSYNDLGLEVFENLMVCAGQLNADACQGDSGGPLYDNTGAILLGVTSFGEGCGTKGFPGVYARLSGVTQWLRDELCPQGTAISLCDTTIPPTSSPLPPPAVLSTSPTSIITIDLQHDGYPRETSWTLTDSNGIVVADQSRNSVSGSFGAIIREIKIDKQELEQLFIFQIVDSANDGICCEYGIGSYYVLVDGMIVARGGAFLSLERTTVIIPALKLTHPTGIPTPPPNDSPPHSPNDFTSGPPASSPTITNQTLACFSGANTVMLQGQGELTMEKLKIGDYVQTDASNPKSFSRVYTFMHWSPFHSTEYLQIYHNKSTKPLEITSDHMIVIITDGVRMNGGPARQFTKAGDVRVGDMVHIILERTSSCNSTSPALSSPPTSFARDATVVASIITTATVTSIKVMSRMGLYAPVTERGTIVVSGVESSCYVALLTPTFIPDNLQHYGIHILFGAKRMWCQVTGRCQKENHDETYDQRGLSEYTAFLGRIFVRVASWSSVYQMATILVMIPILVMSVMVEILFFSGISLSILMVWATLYRGYKYRIAG